jgi:hypothetical protein
MRERESSSLSSVIGNAVRVHARVGCSTAVRTLAFSLVLLWGCGAANVPTAISPSTIEFIVVFTPVGDGATMTAQLGGQTYTVPGASNASLAPGTYQLSGSFRGDGLMVGFQSIGAVGGVQSGSPQNVSGPSPTVTPCGIRYASANASSSASFQLQLQVTSDAKSACSAGAP